MQDGGEYELCSILFSLLEVGVEHPVGEATHADPDALEHTVASQLVHDQGRLHLVVVVINMVMVNMVNKTFRNMTKKRELLCTSPGFLCVLGTRQRTK